MKNTFVRLMVGSLLFSLVFGGAGCTKGPDAATIKAMEPKTLNIWSVIDDMDVYSPIIQAYSAAHPQVSINYRRLRLEEYESALINALAEDRGPDIFLVHNTWVGKYLSKISPMPATTQMAYRFAEGSSTNRSYTYELRNERSITLKQLKESYPDAVASDVIRKVNTAKEGAAPLLEDKVVALPMSVDTLAMYVNKDLLNAAGIPTIPDTWDKFQATIPRLVKIDSAGKILQAGTAMGLAANVERATDIVSVLMMQNGAVMTSDDGYPTFAFMPENLTEQREVSPGLQALGFYLDFANPDKQVYTWNSTMPNSLDAFTQGRVAYFFGYAYHLPTIKARAPKLNLAIAKLPQIENNPVVNFANYWVWTVSKKSKNTDIAWNFINYMTQQDNEKQFLDLAKRPPAHKALIDKYLEDENLGVFASQILTSKSWYKGADPDAMESAMSTMITDGAATDPEDLNRVVLISQDKVGQTMNAGQ
ncbi:MAG: extracellular solute-binding protein [Patescibacteria group bacterium]|nr:extracellular solute-binding protein [Patescibacteria group bacterium]